MSAVSVEIGSNIRLTLGQPIGNGLQLLGILSVRVTDETLDLTLNGDVGGVQNALAFRRLQIESHNGGPITSRTLRQLPLGTYLRLIFEDLKANHPYFVHSASRTGPPGSLSPATAANIEAARVNMKKSDLLPAAAAAYNRGQSDPDPKRRRRAIELAAIELGYSRGHTSRLISEARRLGMLDGGVHE